MDSASVWPGAGAKRLSARDATIGGEPLSKQSGAMAADDRPGQGDGPERCPPVDLFVSWAVRCAAGSAVLRAAGTEPRATHRDARGGNTNAQQHLDRWRQL